VPTLLRDPDYDQTDRLIEEGTYCKFDQNTENCPFSQIKISTLFGG